MQIPRPTQILPPSGHRSTVVKQSRRRGWPWIGGRRDRHTHREEASAGRFRCCRRRLRRPRRSNEARARQHGSGFILWPAPARFDGCCCHGKESSLSFRTPRAGNLEIDDECLFSYLSLCLGNFSISCVGCSCSCYRLQRPCLCHDIQSIQTSITTRWSR